MPIKTTNYEEGPFGRVFFSWKVLEYPQFKRSLVWYLLALVLGLFLIIYSLVIKNYLFILIVILAAFIALMRTFEKPRQLKVQITEDGVAIGNQFFPYENLRNFYIIYRPPLVKKLFFSHKSPLPPLSLNLNDIDPVNLRTQLLELLEEDLEKEHQGLDDILETLLKL